MMGLVETNDANAAAVNVDPVEAAWRLRDAPVRRQRQAEQWQQHDAIDAVVADQHDRIAVMAREHQAQRIGGARRNVLKRLAAGKTHELRGGNQAANRFGSAFLAYASVLNCQAP